MIEDQTLAVHVMPNNDIMEHFYHIGCWCQPVFKEGVWVHKVFSDTYPKEEREPT